MSAAAVYLAIAASFLNLFVQLPLTAGYARELTTSLGAVGVAVAAYSAANLVGNLFAGLAVDRWPRRPLIAAGLVAGGVALWAVGAGPRDVGWLAACLAANGLALAVVTPAAFARLLAARDRAATPSDDGTRLARSGAAIGLAALAGPPIGGLLGDALGPPMAYQAAGAALAAAGLLAGACLGPEPARPDAPEPPPGLGGIRDVAAAPGLRLAYAGAFGLMAVNGALVFLLPPAVKALGAPAAATGGLFGAFALAALVVFLSPVARLAVEAGARRAIATGAVGLAAACASLAAATSGLPGVAAGLAPMAIAMALYGTGFGLVYVGATTSLAGHVAAHLRGTAFGVFYAVFSLGAALGPLALGRLGLDGAAGFAVAALLPTCLAAAIAFAARDTTRQGSVVAPYDSPPPRA